MIRRGTTQCLSFFIGDVINSLEEDTIIYIDFKQNGKIILEFREDNIAKDVENKKLLCKLTQENTLAFDRYRNIYIQIRIKYSNGIAIKSKIVTLKADDLVREGVI